MTDFWRNKPVLLTAGPTQEPIDPVRFISNYSSGKMGIALANALRQAGAAVTLIKGPTHLKAMSEVQEIPVTTAAQMYAATEKEFAQNTVIIFAAAVADYTPRYPATTKIKKQDATFSIELIKTKDIAYELGKVKTANQFTVGFALETNNEQAHALQKLHKKNLDMIVMNSLQDAGAGFQYDTNKISIIYRNGRIEHFELKSKEAVATDILRSIEIKMTNR